MQNRLFTTSEKNTNFYISKICYVEILNSLVHYFQGNFCLCNQIKVTRPSYFVGVPSYFEALWYPHLYFDRKSNT